MAWWEWLSPNKWLNAAAWGRDPYYETEKYDPGPKPAGYTVEDGNLIRPGGTQVTWTPGTSVSNRAGFVAPYSLDSASAPMQRYGRRLGWQQPGYTPMQQEFDDQFQEDGRRTLDPHSYSLSPWQMEQAELNYGIEAPDERVTLHGPLSRVGRYTDDALANMNSKQLDAIRFNNILIPAVEADRALQQPDAIDADYQRRVTEMFGTQGVSQQYAPNTLAALEAMGMGKLRGQDLDEYLSLDRAFNMEEVAALQPWDTETVPELGGYESMGMSASAPMQTVLDMRQIDLAGQLVETALASPEAVGWDEQSRVASFLGQRPPVDQIPFGYLQQGEDRGNEDQMIQENFYQAWFSHFSDPQYVNLEDFWIDAQSYNFTEEDYDQFFNFVYNRTFDPDVQEGSSTMRSGPEIRQFLGME